MTIYFYSPNRRSFRRPGGAVRGQDFVSRASANLPLLPPVASKGLPVVSRGLPVSPAASRGITLLWLNLASVQYCLYTKNQDFKFDRGCGQISNFEFCKRSVFYQMPKFKVRILAKAAAKS